MSCGHIKSGSYCKVCEEKPEKKKPQPISKVSKKRIKENSEYAKVRAAYLKVFPVCEVGHCQGVSVTIIYTTTTYSASIMGTKN